MFCVLLSPPLVAEKPGLPDKVIVSLDTLGARLSDFRSGVDTPCRQTNGEPAPESFLPPRVSTPYISWCISKTCHQRGAFTDYVCLEHSAVCPNSAVLFSPKFSHPSVRPADSVDCPISVTPMCWGTYINYPVSEISASIPVGYSLPGPSYIHSWPSPFGQHQLPETWQSSSSLTLTGQISHTFSPGIPVLSTFQETQQQILWKNYDTTLLTCLLWRVKGVERPQETRLPLTNS